MQPDTSARGGMLSLNFSTPLTGHARSERLNQMTNSHPAFEKSRTTQALLVKIQTTLRRMPGIAANESGEIVSQLQEVGQIISQETSQLVDALANLTLDQQETDKSIARMSIEANLAKARADDHAQTIGNLKDELASANNKREQAEAEVHKIMQDLRELSGDFKAIKDKAEGEKESSLGSDDIIKVGESASSPRLAPADSLLKTLENTVKHLEDQVNNRRSLWIMKHSDPQSVARAIETLADSVQDNQIIHKTLMSLRSGDAGNPDLEDSEQTEVSRQFMPPPARAPSVFQPMSRPPTAGPPPKFGPLQAGPPRAPSAAPGERRYHGVWGPPPSNSRPTPASSALVQSPLYHRSVSRKGFTSTRYRPGAPEFQPSGYGILDGGPSRPPSSFGNRRDMYPNTPTTGPRSRYDRFQNLPSSSVPEYGAAPAIGADNAIAGRSSSVGPLIHMSERTVAAWNGRIMEFYTLIRKFVEKYAALPQDGVSPQLTGSRVWGVLLATYHPLVENEAASYIDYHLKGNCSKSCLVTRVIIDYVVDRIWVPTAWSGVDSETSYALEELERGFARTQGQPSVVRQPLLDRQAAILDSVMKRDQIYLFYNSKVEEIASNLLTTLQPLLNKHTSPSVAYRELEAVAEAAWDLSSSILTSRLTFDFRFPEIGTRFSAQSMLPVWPHIEPLELQSKHWRVAMVTTPVITCRNDTGTNISAHSVALADVFCMQ